MPKINKDLSIVIDVDLDTGGTGYVHNVPVSFEVFKEHNDVLSRTFASLHQSGLGTTAGPRMAAMRLEEIAKNLGKWTGPGGASMLMAEIHRLTNVVLPREDGGGYETLPYDEMLKRNVFDAEGLNKLDGVLVFFSLSWRMHDERMRTIMMEMVTSLWNGRMLSSDITEFANSLTTSTAKENTGATPPITSSVPF